MKRYLFVLFAFFAALSAYSQKVPLYQWRSYLPYIQGLKVVEIGSRIYCGTATGLFYWDKSDNSIKVFSKIDGFSDVFVRTLEYDKEHDILFIAYQNGTLDMLHAGKIITNNDLQNNAINNIYCHGDTAFITYSGGLSIFQIQENQTNTTFGECFGNFGATSATILDQYLYVASVAGVSRIPYNTFLINNCSLWKNLTPDSCSKLVTFSGQVYGAFNGGTLRSFDEGSKTWKVVHHTGKKPIKSLESTHNRLVMTTDDTIYVYDPALTLSATPAHATNDAIVDQEQVIWAANSSYAMQYLSSNASGFKEPYGLPQTTSGYTAYSHNNQVWVSAGFVYRSGAPAFNNDGFYMYDGEIWNSFNGATVPAIVPMRDFCGMAMDTVSGHLWIASLDSGIAEFDPKTKQVLKVFYSGNTGGVIPATSDKYGKFSPASDLAFDKDDNLWAVLYRAPKQLVERKKDGTWLSFQIFTNGLLPDVNHILVDDFGNPWLVASGDNFGVNIFDHVHGNKVNLSTTTGDGGLPSSQVNCIAKDKSGQVWMGTAAGACVFSDPSLLFGSSKKFDVQRPFVNNGPFPGYLLAAQNVTCIAIDGANRKWFGTSNGAYLFNADGDKEILQFTTSNSPLVSNQINAITVNGVTGEVFFVTDRGIMSYRGGATEGGDHNENVYAYPNPVKPGYNGPIAIKGLMNDANVKITDVAGNLVYETTALGGQAVWNGANFSGRQANSGVYLVFITNSDGSQTQITKIMIVR